MPHKRRQIHIPSEEYRSVPNYCENLLEIEGPEEDVKAFRILCQIDDGVINFNALIPIPEHVEMGSRRDWCVANWGTDRWEDFNIREEAATRLIADFATPWAPADKVYREMARRFPRLRIEISAVEEGNEVSYRLKAQNGDIREEEPEITSDFLERIEGAPREVSDCYLERAELQDEPACHPRYWSTRRRLISSLKDYPVYTPPRVGIEMLMSSTDARENFDFFMAQRPVRIEALRRLLSTFEIELDFTEPCKALLDGWVERYGAFLFVRETGSSFLTRNPAWDGCRLGLNVIHDLAVYVGECAIQESPHLSWEMYTDVPPGFQSTSEYFQKPANAGFQGNPRMHYYPHNRVHDVCHALRDTTYLWKKPRFKISEPHNAHFVSKTLRKTYFLARGDIAKANDAVR